MKNNENKYKYIAKEKEICSKEDVVITDVREKS